MKKYLLSIIIITFLGACGKKESRFADGWASVTYGPNFDALFLPMAPFEQKFAVNNDVNDSFTTAKGNHFVIPAGTFVKNNQPYAGVYSIKVFEHFSNSDYLTGGITSVHNSNNHVFTTANAFKFVATDNQDKVLRAVHPIHVSMPDEGKYDARYKLFAGAMAMPVSVNAGGNPNWISWIADTAKVIQGQDVMGSTYDFYFSPTQGVNIWSLQYDGYASQSSALLNIKLPEGYGNVNANVAIFLADGGMLKMTPDINAARYSSGYQLPVGVELKVLTIINIGERLGYDLRKIKLVKDETIAIEKLTPATSRELTDIIQNGL